MSNENINPLAGKLMPHNKLTDITKLVSSYYCNKPDGNIPEQKVSFGTSGHRGSSFDYSFNEMHVLCISQAICDYRKKNGIDGPLFIGIDSHALSYPAYVTAVEVLAANSVILMLAKNEELTPTPVISHSILKYNSGRSDSFADGIVITPSHNPPTDGGFKYNPPNGGPAGTEVTKWIQSRANELLLEDGVNVRRIEYSAALKRENVHFYDYIQSYVDELDKVLDLPLISQSKIAMGVDPLGGAGVRYWPRIAEKYKLNLSVLNDQVDPTFRFMSVDWDGQIRMDPSSKYAMNSLIGLKDKFDISFACDTDHDRHGIVTSGNGLMPPNHYLAVSIFYLLKNRNDWNKQIKIGKTLVSSQMIDRVAGSLGNEVYEVPVGFKWFADGLYDGSLGFVGEESAGATFLKKDGTVWTTDKDGIIPALLSAEITVKMEKDPSLIYKDLENQFGVSIYKRKEAAATVAQKKILSNLSPDSVKETQLAGDQIEKKLTKAPGNNASIGGLKVTTKNGWFAARPSGTEDIYKIYAESFVSEDHLTKLLNEAQAIVDKTLKT